MGKKLPSKRKTSLKECAEALRKSGGFLTGAARLLNITPAALCDRIKRHPELKAVQDEVKETYLDLAETALLKKVKALDLGAICFYLKCQGKKRGYVERQEIAFDDVPMPTKVVFEAYDGRRKGGDSDTAE